MKAYMVGLNSDPDAGNEIIFAKNTKEARVKAHHTNVADWQDSYIDVYVRRSPAFDGMENATDTEMMYKQFKEGWWFKDFNSELAEDCTFEEFNKALKEK